MQRRQLLRAWALSGIASTVSARTWAAPGKGQPRFLLVFLRGAYDCASLLVPTARESYDFYASSRPHIAIAAPGEADGALALDANWGLHPAVGESMLALYVKKQLAFVPFAGINDLTRSHFETQDAIELGQSEQGQRNFNSGFLNRLARVLGAEPAHAVQAMAFTDALPLSLRGSAPASNMALAKVGRAGVSPAQAKTIAAMYHGTPLGKSVSEGFEVRSEVFKALDEEMQAASRGAVGAQGFEVVAQRMGKLMRERFNLGFVDVGGWDTHVGQGNVHGALANRLGALGQGLAGFAQEMGPAWKETVVIVISEFGRTFRENGNQGTDHGHGSVYWVLGGALAAQAGGRVLGEQVRVAQDTLFQNRDYPVLNEYRAVLGGLFMRLYGLSQAQAAQVFAGVKPQDLRLL